MNTFGPTAAPTKVNGTEANSMAAVSTKTKKVIRRRVNGDKERSSDRKMDTVRTEIILITYILIVLSTYSLIY